MSAHGTMLLIDADNVSVDVMEQAVAQLLQEHGALHVRRAYCTAESALKHQAVFKRLGIRPMVNLAAGKNSTDIALAVDALDLVLAERPAVVAIASSDSDFAPLVGRLREKGCRVVGMGQAGKTGDETQTVYDDYTVFEHRRPHGAAPAAKAPARAPAKSATKAPAKAATKAAPKATRKTPRGRAAAPAVAAAPAPAVSDKLQQILAAIPELDRGETVELRVAAERLRAAGLMSRSGTSPKVFGAFPERFELVPARQPNKVRLRD
ncbi:MAG: NYN domain-containing protein [Rubrivivax sp.]|nr:NYN domain-containing protein [Rubrivivax sp.]MDH5339382.1 NYN domain-containing protein [Rubrivivax sp.]